MDEYGFVRVATAVPKTAVADVEHNVREHLRLFDPLSLSDLIVFPELSLTGYTCGDLFAQRQLIDDAWEGFMELAGRVRGSGKTVIVGLPVYVEETSSLYNCAGVISGRSIAVVPKSYIPNYREFYEARWFTAANGTEPKTIAGSIPFGTDLLFKNHSHGWMFGVEICEDVWSPMPPSTFQALAGATILVNLSASNDTVGKADYRRNLVKSQSGRLVAGYVYCSAGPHESTSDLVFGGHCLIAENGELIAESYRFGRDSREVITCDIDVDKLRHERATMPGTFGECAKRNHREFRHIDICGMSGPRRIKRILSQHPFVPDDEQKRDERCSEIFDIQVCGLAKRIERMPTPDSYIGVSGGLDSTLALLVAAQAYDRLNISRKHIHGYTMPGFGTSSRTKNNALVLMDHLGVTQGVIDIRETCLMVMQDIKHNPFGLDLIQGTNVALLEKLLANVPDDGADLVFENLQARMRTLFLMSKGFVIGTGDLSELALGWCTYNGDHMSMYNVNASVPKTLVRYMVEYAAGHAVNGTHVLLDIASTDISPELLPLKDGEIVQKTETILGPYELHDFFLYHFVRNGFTPEKILALAHVAFDGDPEGRYTVADLAKYMRKFVTMFFRNQFKRDCVPNGPKVGSVSLSPRGDWRMPSDAEMNIWLKSIDKWEKNNAHK